MSENCPTLIFYYVCAFCFSGEKIIHTIFRKARYIQQLLTCRSIWMRENHAYYLTFWGATLPEHLHTTPNSLALVTAFRDAAKCPHAQIMLAFNCTEVWILLLRDTRKYQCALQFLNYVGESKRKESWCVQPKKDLPFPRYRCLPLANDRDDAIGTHIQSDVPQ